MQAKSEVVSRSILSASSSRPAKFFRSMLLGFTVAIASVAVASPSKASGGPGYAGIVVDAKTGNVLYSDNADTLHYPASLTKMMTLYLTFEALESGRIKIDSQVPFSAHAAAQAPTKLNVRAGGSVTVEQAILSMVTLSANDAAMALGEYIGGSEENFAHLMNNKAHALGMTRTTYRNPNGLPNTAQMTTARDQARLGMALREHFPQYYGYFSTHSFQFGNRVIGNHNRLLGSVRGVDGIKTGYTRAAGFNLVTSAQVDGRSIVGVVLGGVSTPARDNQMRKLVATYLPQASVHAGPSNLIAQTAPDRATPQKAVPTAPDANAAAARMALDTNITKSIPAQDQRYDESRPSSEAAFAAVTPKSSNPLVVGKLHQQKVPANEVASIAPSYAEASTDTNLVDTVTTGSTGKIQKSANAGPGGWVIQVGVSPSKELASNLLDDAKSKGGKALQSAKPYAVAFGSGSSQIYRARFGGFDDQRDAVNACNVLKRSGMKCWASAQ
ncbi:D-alanyl-D-alanine carboxypeptidase [Rhizobium tubonense]|uniref:D-alanyl-D-alanine carboxypeptidase n=1 Tax=Rhizobium tubonense TaxID=484088 RepID=A0A2W4CZW4_9HYPH|nr:D-alanyl-D-alanine carboxypeptidase [Rhizobium tubonense]PZM10784.1 D-alanyl-D-alanine carboxypeptidase [Rhizobium tubonense]